MCQNVKKYAKENDRNGELYVITLLKNKTPID